MKPSPAQLQYLKILADRTGTTFTPPKTRSEASREIDRLKALPTERRDEVARERRQVAADLQAGRGDSVRYRRRETAGYGSEARWAHNGVELRECRECGDGQPVTHTRCSSCGAWLRSLAEAEAHR
ncbi:MAG: hypothetical protein JSR84_01050 [Proteobacteria bacterium]|nr:hypothetical protein [Pseudomonadota bacterium]